jgi:hypothetical protein
MVPDRDRADARKIHIRLLPDLHRRLRIRCAELDVTIQDFVVDLLERELGEPPGAGGGSGATSRNRDRGGEGDAE